MTILEALEGVLEPAISHTRISDVSGEPMSDRPALDLVFWPGSVRNLPFEDHVKAAAAGGFTSLAIAPDFVKEAATRGKTIRDLVSIAEDAGVPIRHLDTITDWAPVRYPAWLEGPLLSRFDVSMDEGLGMAEALGVETILAFPGFDMSEAAPLEVLADGFGRLVDRAADIGAAVQLEFAPMLGVPNLASAWDIVRESGRPHAGLMIDVWHFFKGGLDLALLESIPAQHLWSVQVSDGWVEARDASQLVDGLYHRAFPGEGELPIIRVLEIVSAKGNLRMVGPETFSTEADSLGASDAGIRDGDGTRAVLASAGLLDTLDS
jgi:sugar phosphate isomerase/epimerase